ncbi:hypothetical protein ABIE12_001739 [Serratia sp. 509]
MNKPSNLGVIELMIIISLLIAGINMLKYLYG